MGNKLFPKRICIVTWHKVPNYGAQLQAYALKRILEQYGCEVSYYNYIRVTRKHNVYNMIKNPIKTIGNAMSRSQFKQNEQEYYRNKNEILKQFLDIEFMEASLETKYDICLIGSDEIFSIFDGYNAFQYGEGIIADKYVSYAASFGATDYGMLLFYNKKSKIKKLLKKFEYISVRDENSKQIVTRLIKQEPYIHIDPVLLWNWKEEISSYEGTKTNILVIYSYGTHEISERIKMEIGEYSRNNNLEVVSVGYYHNWCKRNINISSLDFLECMYKAECIITTTFHGAVLSILFDKQFGVVTQSNNCEKLEYLLKEFDADNHVVTDCNIERVLGIQQSFKELLEIKRSEAKEYLEKILE